MKIFLTGGSGFIGTHFRRALEGKDVVYYDLRDPQYPSSHTYIKGDIRDKAAVMEAMKGCDVVIHLAAIWDDFSADDSEYFSTNVDGTQVLIEVAKHYGIKTFVNYSSVSVYGYIQEATVETTPHKPENAYGHSKSQAEDLFPIWIKEDPSVSILHIRPSVVFGELNYGNIYRLVNQIHSGFHFNIARGNALKSISYVENLVDATLFLMDKMKPGIDAYNYADKPHMNGIEIGNIIATAMNKSKPWVIPYPMAIAMAIPFDILIKITGKNLPISSMRVKKFCTQTLNSCDKVLAAGFKPRFTSQEGLQKMVTWYLSLKK